MRVVFMGTPDFAVPCLQKLIDNALVLGVVTQPDRPKGRGQKVQFSPVKELALKYNIPVYQPEKIKNDKKIIDEIKSLSPDFIVVVAFGQILTLEVLNIPKYGCINVHASLLPKLRGAAPINWSIINGDKKTGITTMMMDEGIDTGDILMQREIDIREDETAGELHDELMQLGADMILETLHGIKSGSINRIKQDDLKSSYVSMIHRDLGHINWKDNAINIYNLVRGVTPFPGSYTFYNNKIIKIWKCSILDKDYKAVPGEIIEVGKDGIIVSCGSGAIKILEIQELGGKRMDVSSYLNGHLINKGEILL